MNNEQESDKQEYEGMAKKRILKGIIPLSDSLYIPKRKGLSSVQSKMDCEDMELMKLCLSRNIDFIYYAHVFVYIFLDLN
ncbi:hypothetical protein RO3G_11673 [Rhizopus delemar RA 99-880]|uniref:Uncharacterized protein n=1 Tax=Rhizopus delemar (strain RA 99-880 / ATCC MYA-4621 / FGSC 9543 / NRRL 43880) TaxID=246409 RepID=I1CET2_RHIO9|nr:hypothetical protein RO3G_11673 [Rhizopus delemar RA 99-880]|eukprot:EIE86962.1 hypothetical protein RO3G_11673 [Rhizopus delemar RA 99-880]